MELSSYNDELDERIAKIIQSVFGKESTDKSNINITEEKKKEIGLENMFDD